jgi:hypothetical protein
MNNNMYSYRYWYDRYEAAKRRHRHVRLGILIIVLALLLALLIAHPVAPIAGACGLMVGLSGVIA